MRGSRRIGATAAVGFLVLAVGTLPFEAQDTCTAEELGRALTVDTTQLRKVSYEGPSSESAEGRGVDGFYAGDTLKVLSLAYYGEMGKTLTTYYLTSPTRYVAAYTMTLYTRPIYAGEVEVSSEVRGYFYVCDGASVAVEGPGVSDLQRRLEEGQRLLDRR